MQTYSPNEVMRRACARHVETNTNEKKNATKE